MQRIKHVNNPENWHTQNSQGLFRYFGVPEFQTSKIPGIRSDILGFLSSGLPECLDTMPVLWDFGPPKLPQSVSVLQDSGIPKFPKSPCSCSGNSRSRAFWNHGSTEFQKSVSELWDSEMPECYCPGVICTHPAAPVQLQSFHLLLPHSDSIDAATKESIRQTFVQENV